MNQFSDSLNSKTAVVTGGGNGIGREIALTFARHGARVVSIDTDGAGNGETARRIAESGGECSAVAGDVSSAADVARSFAIAGAVDVLVNNAAAWVGDGWLHEVSEDNWDRILAVTLKSVYLCSRTALDGMMERGRGSIVNISSVNAVSGIHLAAYTAAKGGILSLTKLLALQYGPHGIRTNAICPGTIETESTHLYYEKHPEMKRSLLSLYPAGKFGEPADVAECALYLASDRAKFMNGSIVVLDGGLSAIHKIPSMERTAM